MLVVSEYNYNYDVSVSCSVLDEVDSQFALLTAALEKMRIEQVLQVRVHTLLTQVA